VLRAGFLPPDAASGRRSVQAPRGPQAPASRDLQPGPRRPRVLRRRPTHRNTVIASARLRRNAQRKEPPNIRRSCATSRSSASAQGHDDRSAGLRRRGLRQPSARDQPHPELNPGGPHGMILQSIPDRADEIADIIAKGDRVWALWTVSGTYLGDIHGIRRPGFRCGCSSWASGLRRRQDDRVPVPPTSSGCSSSSRRSPNCPELPGLRPVTGRPEVMRAPWVTRQVTRPAQPGRAASPDVPARGSRRPHRRRP
jgi:hypothetical protein